MTENDIATPGASRSLVIVGAGGFGLEVLWVVARINEQPGGPVWNVLGFVDDAPELRGCIIEGLPVLGPAQDFAVANAEAPVYFHCALGNNGQRQKLALMLEERGFLPATLIDPSALVSPRAELGAGCFIGPHVVVSLEVALGRHVLVNTGTSIGHHSRIGDFAQLCPGTRVSGNCDIGRLAFLGSNAVVHPRRRVGEETTVAAGSYVLRDAPPRTLVSGVPALIQSLMFSAPGPAEKSAPAA